MGYKRRVCLPLYIRETHRVDAILLIIQLMFEEEWNVLKQLSDNQVQTTQWECGQYQCFIVNRFSYLTEHEGS